ncbi:MAG: DsrE family protein [Hyphomicrobiaceae bacterium]
MKYFLAACCAMVAMLSASTYVNAGEKMKVVYHVSEADRVAFALNNMKNHIKGVGGPEKIELVLVAHGPALKAFHELAAVPKISKRVTELQSIGVKFEACGNTMRAQAVQLDDLLPKFTRRDEGGVVRIAELQFKGYAYIRP